MIYLISISTYLVDCVWSSWKEWTTCSRSCGGGKRSTKRTSNQPRNRDHLSPEKTSCPTEEVREEECNVTPCPGIHFFIF